MSFILTTDISHSAIFAWQMPGKTLQGSERYFSFGDSKAKDRPFPWEAAFPNARPLGYWEAFSRRCAKLCGRAVGLVDEGTAKKVWLDILRDYEDYVRMGMWLPEQIMDEHRRVASALGWFARATVL